MRDAAALQVLAELARRRPVVAASQRNAAADAAALLRSFYYPKQSAFFRSPAKRKATSKTRRAGATTGGCIELIARSIERPGFRATIVHSTRVEARQRAWLSDTQSGLVDVLRRYGTPVPHPAIEVVVFGGVRADIRDQAMTIDFSNGSRIDLFGFDDERAMRKQRGLAKHVYWIDEAQDIRFLEGFYNKVVMAALDDYGGECWLSGTPGQDCSGMFYEITRDETDNPRSPEWTAWEVHAIAQIDNPFFGHVVADSSSGWLVYYVEDNLTKETGVKHGPYVTYAEAEKAAGQVRWDRTAGAALKAKGWKGDEPDFIREYLGRWCKQDARFVYPVHSANPYDLLYAVERPCTPDKVSERDTTVIANWRNHINPVTGQPPFWCDFDKAITDLPKRRKFNQNRQWMYSIGVDFGFNPDPFAIVVWAFSNDSQDVYELFSWKAQKVHTDDQGLYLLKVWQKLNNVVSLVGDPANKQDDFEMWRTRLNLPIEEANKKGKNVLEEFLADDIRRGRVHLRRDSSLHDEMKHLLYLPLKIGKTREVAKHRRAGDGVIHGDHCCFAAGTPVRTEHGDIMIEDVQIGDRALTRLGWRPVTRAWMTGVKSLWRVTLDNGRYIDGTADHPFWTQDGWKPLASLTPRDTLIECPNNSAARIRVLRVEPLHRNAPVYNITVDGEHEFFANGVLVSNCDAARYAYSALTHYLSKLPPDPADKGTREALTEEAERIEQRLDQREARRAAAMADGDEDYLASIGGDHNG